MPVPSQNSATKMLLPITGPDDAEASLPQNPASTMFFNFGLGLLGLGLVMHGIYFSLSRGK